MTLSSLPNVYVVDDDPSFRKAVSRLLTAAGYRVLPFASAEEFLEELAVRRTGCVVLDLSMPGLSGLALQEALTRSEEPLPVVFLSGTAEIPDVVRALRTGAIDFLTKPVNPSHLLDAVGRALARAEQAGKQQAQLREWRCRFDRLTPRERAVMALVVQGRLNKQIAAELGTKVCTVKVHRGNVMAKLEVESVAELVRIAEQLDARQRSGLPTLV